MQPATPGPWHMGLATDGKTPHVREGHALVVAICPLDPHDWQEANAHLISAAPDLLAIAKEILKDFNNGDVGLTYEQGQALRQAIGKAGGA